MEQTTTTAATYKGIDCCTPLNAAQAQAVKDAGYRYVGRYLVPEGYAKALRAAEAHAISAAGLGLFCIWETTANRALDGVRGGMEDGKLALKCAQGLGMPTGKPIYFCVDFEAFNTHLQLITSYMLAAKAEVEKGGYCLGVYGSYATVAHLAQFARDTGDDALGRYLWQCAAWSYGRHCADRRMYQYLSMFDAECQALAAKIGVNVDINQCDDMEAAGIWRYREDEIMEINRIFEAMTDEQAARIVEKAQTYFAKMPLPGSWDAEGELDEARALGITDAARPMGLATRLETAVMVKRAVAGLAADRNDGGNKNVPGKPPRVVWEDSDVPSPEEDACAVCDELDACPFDLEAGGQ